MKKHIRTILLGLLFFTASALQAQSFDPFQEDCSPSFSWWEEIVDSIKTITLSIDYCEGNGINPKSLGKFIYYFNTKGLCIQLTSDNSVVKCFYDSLDHLVATDYGEWQREVTYDSLGHISHSIVVAGADTNWAIRYFYDEKGRCISNEIFSTDIEARYVFEYEGYDYRVKRNIFRYDSLDRCIWTATIVDGDTTGIHSRQFGTNGKILELTEWNPIIELTLTSLYFYDDEDRLVKEKDSHFGETIYEYNEENCLVNKRHYNSEWDFREQWRWKYDSHNNPIESIYESGSANDVHFSVIYKYDYEYYK